MPRVSVRLYGMGVITWGHPGHWRVWCKISACSSHLTSELVIRADNERIWSSRKLICQAFGVLKGICHVELLMCAQSYFSSGSNSQWEDEEGFWLLYQPLPKAWKIYTRLQESLFIYSCGLCSIMRPLAASAIDIFCVIFHTREIKLFISYQYSIGHVHLRILDMCLGSWFYYPLQVNGCYYTNRLFSIATTVLIEHKFVWTQRQTVNHYTMICF